MARAKQSGKQVLRETLDAILGSPLGQAIIEELARKYLGRSSNTEGRENPYEVLGLSPDADTAVVRAAYRELAKKYHPDNKSTGSDEMMARINWAYHTIMKERQGGSKTG